MNAPLAGKQASISQATGIIDCDIHPMLKHPRVIRDYLPTEWHRHFDKYGDFIRQPFTGALVLPRAAPALSRRDAWPPAGGPPGSDLDFMREQHLDPMNVECGILQVLFPVANKQRNPDYAAVLCKAVNDWQMEEWTRVEPRLKGSIVVPLETTEASVAEIDRLGGLPDFAQVLLCMRSDEPIGWRRYRPIFAAAVRHDLPVAFHSGGVNGRPHSGTGHTSFFFEEHNVISAYAQAMIANMIFEGLFNEFPALRVLIIESGMGWVPAFGWRMDQAWERARDEVPHLTQLPSELLRKHFWFSTQPIEEPENPEDLRQLFDWIGWDKIMFSSDYPHWDQDDPRYSFPLKMTDEQRRGIFHDNSKAAFGF